MKAIVLITAGTGPAEVREFVGLLAREMERRCRSARTWRLDDSGGLQEVM